MNLDAKRVARIAQAEAGADAMDCLGEGFLSLSIALVFGHFANPWAWTYFVFIVTLFTLRQRFDERQCAEKYGAEKWAEYQARVKYRIVLGIY